MRHFAFIFCHKCVSSFVEILFFFKCEFLFLQLKLYFLPPIFALQCQLLSQGQKNEEKCRRDSGLFVKTSREFRMKLQNREIIMGCQTLCNQVFVKGKKKKKKSLGHNS